MRYIFSVFLLLSVLLQTKAQDIYDVDLISQTLKNRANAVIRNEKTDLQMLAPDNVIYNVKSAITVLNKNGENTARLVLFYDKNTSIKFVKGEVYNEVGKQIGKFSQSDFKDESAVNDFSLFEDTRKKYYSPATNSYPYTVVYNYEIRFKQNLILPRWEPKSSNAVAVEKSTFTFSSKPEEELRFKTVNYPNAPVESKTEKLKTLTYSVENQSATKAEPFSPNIETYLTSVQIASKNFEYFNYKGNYNNWNELGKWYFESLLKGRQALSTETITTIKNLVKNVDDDLTKARIIYQYMQNKTRYISVQVGIGGFQPFKATDVDRLGYGDCKGLVNYMQSLLEVVNVPSFYCVVEAGAEKKSLDPNFASMDQGNHIILCLPLKSDTTWLECTSQKIPFGYLGDFTDDRYVLACTPNGGKILRTPKYTAKESVQLRRADLAFDVDGNITGKAKTSFEGWQYENHEYLIGKSPTEQQNLLKDIYDVDNINFDHISFKQQKNIKPVMDEDLTLSIRNYGTINNSKIYFNPNIFSVENTVAETKIRTLPIYVSRGYTNIDTVIYKLNDETLPVLLPLEKELKTRFGSYNLQAKIKENQLFYIRKFTLNDGTFPASDYNEFASFLNEVSSNDKLKLIFNLKK